MSEIDSELLDILEESIPDIIRGAHYSDGASGVCKFTEYLNKNWSTTSLRYKIRNYCFFYESDSLAKQLFNGPSYYGYKGEICLHSLRFTIGVYGETTQ